MVVWPTCRLRNSDCGFWIAEYSNADWGMRNADCKNRETKECDNHYLSKQWVKGREYEIVGSRKWE